MPDSQTLVLLVAAMVAGVVCFRLYSILGRRTGHEPPPKAAPAPQAPNALQPPAQPVQTSNGILEIQLADNSFDTPKFLAGAREAYAQIVNAFVAGDRDTLRPLLSPDVFAAFDAGITARTAPPPALVKISDARISGSALHGRDAEITVTFTAEFASATGSNNVVVDVWSFERNLDSTDPNWVLVATSGDVPE